MIRKLVVVLLTGVMCLVGITSALAQKVYPTLTEYETLTGKKIEKFSEAPMLRVKVAAGELPPVEERLPDEPLVVAPRESIGKYGGILNLLQRWPGAWSLLGRTYLEPLLRRDLQDLKKVAPNLVKNWKLSEDDKSLTLYLRKGIRWSDGEPFTTDDILFWYNDVLLNKELTPVIPADWKPGGEVMKVEKVDDYTVRLKFSKPWPGVMYALSGREFKGYKCFLPAHYLKKFHIKYNPEVEKLVKKEGLDYWYQLFANKSEFHRDYYAEGLPILGAWIREKETTDHTTLVRNPYYWKIDTQGNQLPYIDRVRAVVAGQSELRVAKMFAGEPDYFGDLSSIEPKQLPVLKQTAEKNNYKIFFIENTVRVVEEVIMPNHTTKDPFVRKLLNNVEFKKALSLAINRDEINEAVFMGIAEPMQVTVAPSSRYFEERFAKAYIQYDPETARKLLDEIGLKRNKEGYILDPDGKPLILILETAPHIPTDGPVAELIKEYWDEIGIKMSIHLTPSGTMWDLFGANESQLTLWNFGPASDSSLLTMPQWWASGWFVGQEWQTWINSDGKQGTEPTPQFKEFVNIWHEVPYILDEEKRGKMIERALELQAENLWFIGVVRAKIIGACRTSLKNIQTESPPLKEYPILAFQWYFEK